ncbi:radical SAM protein [Candidatus Woesearchaeota archaeon]|nr:radical SAM protein [Candidatus Woesearchaeota archaeon]
MKILLLHPSNQEVYQNIQQSVTKLDKKSAKTPPIGIMYLAAVLKQNNYDVEILDAEASNLNLQETLKEIRRINPDILGMTCTTPLYNAALIIAKDLRKDNKQMKIVLGGPHISALPYESVSNPEIDFIVKGEGEYSFLNLVKGIEKSKNEKNYDFSQLKGIGYLIDGKPFLTPPQELIQNLDELPFPARELTDMDKYLKLYTGKKYSLMVTSRGCPYQCIFCDSVITFGKRTRFRSPDNVIAEIKELVEKYGITDITFSDDTFTLDKERTIEICKKIVENNLDIKFICSSRANTIDEERLEWLKKAGCIQITFGIESGDDNILRIIKKGITTDMARKAIALVKKYGIGTHASYMLGNPGETLETVRKTINFARELDTDYAQFSIATPFPGTEMWDMASKQGLIKIKDFSKFTWYYSPTFETKELPGELLIKLQKEAYGLYKGGKQGQNEDKK